jgi:hypothetical protein
MRLSQLSVCHASLCKRLQEQLKRMHAERSHLRHGGIYASRNTYLRIGETSPAGTQCTLCTHRYFRFFSTANFRHVPLDPISRVWKLMHVMPRSTCRHETPRLWPVAIEGMHPVSTSSHNILTLDACRFCLGPRLELSMSMRIQPIKKLTYIQAVA